MIATITKGDYVGEIAFFTDMERTALAKSVQFVHCFYLDKKKFLQILPKFEQDHQIFCDIRDSILIYQDYSPLNIQCLGCNQYDHPAKLCPNLHFIV